MGKGGPWKEEQTPESHSSIDQVHREVRTAPNMANAPSLGEQLERDTVAAPNGHWLLLNFMSLCLEVQ